MQSNKDITYIFRVKSKTIADLKKISLKEGISVSQLIREAIYKQYKVEI